MEHIFSSYFASLITEEDKVELSSAENIILMYWGRS